MYHLSNFLAGTPNPAHFTDNDGVSREGIARLKDEWAEELGLSEKQFRLVLKKAEALGFIVRARRLRRGYHVFCLHVAVTEKYNTELTRCVSLGPKAYRKAIRAAHHSPTISVEGRHLSAHLGVTERVEKGLHVAPIEGLHIEDSSQTHIRTLRETATSFAVADSPSAFPETESKKEKSEILESESIQETNQIPEEEEIQRAKPENANGEDSHLTHTINFGVADLTVTTTSVELFEKFSVGNAKDAGHVATVTSHGLATKFSALGLLTEWQRGCVKHGVPSPDNVTDEQLAALSWWCSAQPLAKAEDRILFLIEAWDEVTKSYCTSGVGKEQQLKATEKPDLDFVRQVMEVCTLAGRPPMPITPTENAYHQLVDVTTLRTDKISALELVWKTECTRRGMTNHGFTMKMRGQLKQIIQKLPAGTAPAFVTRVIRQWVEFTWKAERDHGAFNSPNQPNLAYLLKYLDAGSHLKDEEPPKPKETQTVARPKPVKPQKERPRKMTAEETLAALAEPLECEILADQRSKEARVYQGIRR
jgi:hypothetical protein